MNHATPSIRLAAKVAAVNRANAYALTLYPLLAAALAPFVGRKVVTVGGELMETVKKALPEFPNTVGLSVYRLRSAYSLGWVVKTCESYPEGVCGCCYHETSIHAGELDGQTLKAVTDAPTGLRSDYRAEEIDYLRDLATQAKEMARNAENACHPFGLSDY